MNDITREEYIRHEVQLKVQEFKTADIYMEIKNVYEEIKGLDQKIDRKIDGLYYLIIGAVSVPVILFFINLWINK